MELVTRTRKNDGTFSLPFININFEFLEICFLFGIPIEIRKLVTMGWASREER